MIEFTENRATGVEPEAVCLEMPSVWPGLSDRISQSIGPGVQVPAPLTTVPGSTANRTLWPPWSTPSSTSIGCCLLGRMLSRSSGSIVLMPPPAVVIASET